MCRAADAIIFVSQADMNAILQSQPELAKKSHHVPVGVDRSIYCLGDRRAARDALHLPRDAKAIAWVGRIEKEKNLPALIEACAQIPDCHLWIAGAGTQEEHCWKRTNDRVRFFGRMDSRGIATLLQAANALALASEYEGLPTVVLEAWACGRAVVVPPVGDLPELLAKGGGYLVPDNRPENLAYGIRAVLQSEEEEADLCARSAPYDWERIADRIVEIYTLAARQHASETQS